MAGKYKKAPLLYMTARINTLPLPRLTGDQQALTQQVMSKCDLPFNETSRQQGLKVLVGKESSSAPNTYEVAPDTYKRVGFFSKNRTEALIFNPEGVEWRTANYGSYNALCKRVDKVLSSLCEKIDDAYSHIQVREIELAYADVVIPFKNRELSDYFSDDGGILPLGHLHKNKMGRNEKQYGYIEMTRIIDSNKAVTVGLEQLPFNRDEFSKCKLLPQPLIEIDRNFSMPLSVHQEWRSSRSPDYGLLLTRAAMTIPASRFPTLREFNFKNRSEPIYNLVQATFNDVINKKICREDWEYIKEE